MELIEDKSEAKFNAGNTIENRAELEEFTITLRANGLELAKLRQFFYEKTNYEGPAYDLSDLLDDFFNTGEREKSASNKYYESL